MSRTCTKTGTAVSGLSGMSGSKGAKRPTNRRRRSLADEEPSLTVPVLYRFDIQDEGWAQTRVKNRDDLTLWTDLSPQARAHPDGWYYYVIPKGALLNHGTIAKWTPGQVLVNPKVVGLVIIGLGPITHRHRIRMLLCTNIACKNHWYCLLWTTVAR